VEGAIYNIALARCNFVTGTQIPGKIAKRLRGIVNSTVRHAVRPGFYADLNDRKVRQMIISESLKHLVWSFKSDETRQSDFVTPDLSDEELETALRAEEGRLAGKKTTESLRTEINEKQRSFEEQQAYASSNVEDEIPEITPEELQQSPETSATNSDELENLELDAPMKTALKAREERRKLILSRLDEPDVPEWLKHAVDTEDTQYFPMASGRFKKQKDREALLTEFFQKELGELTPGSEEETQLLGFMEKLVADEESGLFDEESVEDIKKRVHAMLKKIEDQKEPKE
jgi:hypothetical protein